MSDKTESSKMRRWLKEHEHLDEHEFMHLARSAVENAALMVLWFLPEGRIIYANERTCRKLGYSRQELIGLKTYDIDVNFTSQRHLDASFRAVKKQGALEFETDLKRQDGSTFPVHVTTHYIEFEGGEYEFAFVRDISQRKKAEEKLRYMSFHDRLTGLYNRSYASEEFRRIDEGSRQPISLILLDVEGLQEINEEAGYELGNEVLKKTGDMLRHRIRKQDIASRWGDDEFLLILPRTGREEAEQVLGRIEAAARDLQIEGLNPSFKCGLAVKDNEDKNIHRIIDKARKEMQDL